jgi:hypothetical protein
VCRYFEVHREGRRSIGHDLTEGSTASEGSPVDLAHTEAADAELVRMIERRSRKGEVDREELEPVYIESVRRYNARRREEMRAAWCEYHQGQAARHRAVLETLIARHEGEAAKLMDVQPEGEAELGAQKPHEQRWPEAQGRGMGS